MINDTEKAKCGDGHWLLSPPNSVTQFVFKSCTLYYSVRFKNNIMKT